LNNQPANASDRSVHPTGMAVDLRRPNIGSCRAWLENVLLQLEGADVLDATRESRPPHYHIVLFPRQYTSYVGRVATRRADVTVAEAESESDVTMAEATDESGDTDRAPVQLSAPESSTYRVRAGDSLWTIAQKLGTTVARLRAENDLRSNRIYAGQVIVVPGR
jgi:LysM repeat protein